jgi:hypothetical protein
MYMKIISREAYFARHMQRISNFLLLRSVEICLIIDRGLILDWNES